MTSPTEEATCNKRCDTVISVISRRDFLSVETSVKEFRYV